MHIAVVTSNMGAGGAERVIAQLLQEWSNRDIQCSLICMNPKDAFYLVPETVVRYDVPCFSDNSNVDKIRKYAHLRSVVKKLAPDIVLAMPEEIGIYVLPALLGTGIPVVVSERNNPWVMPYKKISRILRSMFYPFAAGLIFQTEQAASFFPVSQRKKGIVLPNPLENGRLPEVYEGRREKTVISAGRLEPQKNFPLLIKAFALFHEKHPDYQLVIYGEGGQRCELETFAQEKLPGGSWSMPGKVSDLPERIGRCGIFALSSDYEGVPNVLIEAMAVGTPCVSTDCAPGGAASLIDNRENGILVPVGDADALAEGLCYMADHPDEAAAMGEKAVEIREKLDAGQVCGQWQQYLQTVCKRNARKIRGFGLTVRDKTYQIRYEPILITLVTILTTLSGWALALNDSTMATPFTTMLSKYTIYGCVMGILMIYLLSPIQYDFRYRFMLFAPVVYWCMFYFLRYDKGLPINITSAVMLCLFVLLTSSNKRRVYQCFRKVLIIICVCGIVCYALYALGAEVLFTRYEYYTPEYGGEYVSYGFGSMYLVDTQLRLCGHYNEPGFLGTITALILCVENLNLKKPGNWILLIAGCLTYSMAFFVIIAVYLAINCIPILIKKPVLWIGVAVMVLFYLFVFPHIRTGHEAIDTLLQRFVLTKDGLAGNNRGNSTLDLIVSEVLQSRDFLIGRGAGYFSSLKSGAVLSYKTYVVEYGVLGTILIYGSLLLSALKISKKNIGAISMICVFALSIYQRPHVMNLLYFVILYGGVEHILHRDVLATKK